MSTSAEVLVLNPVYWRDKVLQLAQILRTLPSGQVPDPTGSPPDPERTFTIVDPAYWASQPRELGDALDLFSGVQHTVEQDRLSSGIASTTVERLTLTVEEAAQVLGISRAFAYESVRRGEIPHIRIGRRVLVPRAALNRLLSEPQGEPER